MTDKPVFEGAYVVRDDVDHDRYVIEVDGDLAGFTEYKITGDRFVFPHTEIADKYARRGLASHLIREALDDVRARGGTIVPICPYVVAWIRAHPEYLESVDQTVLHRLERLNP
jgi:hypothetical protein